MRVLTLVSLIVLSPSLMFAQTAPAKAHCSVQPARALTDADEAYRSGDAALAESLWAAKVAAAPSTVSYGGLLRAELQQNKLEEALATSKADIAALPAAAETYTNAGDVLLRVGHIPEASLAFSKALSIDQCSARAHLGWGRVNGILSHHVTEAHELQAAHALAPADPEVTVAWIEAKPAVDREAALSGLLAANPVLPPDLVNRLASESAVLEAKAFCTPVSEAGVTKFDLQPIPFEDKGTRSWAFKVNAHGNNLGLMELDSSVSGIVLNPGDAAKAGAHAVGPKPLHPFAPYTAIVDSIRIGTVEYHGCAVRVAQSVALADANSVIGLDFFRDHLIHLDYVAKTLTLTPLPVNSTGADGFVAETEKDWTQVYVAGNTMFVPTLINKKGPFLFIINTGTYSAVISPTLVKSMLIQSANATVNRHGMSGEIVRVVPKEGGVVDVSNVYGPDGKLIKISNPVKLPVFRFAKSEFADPTTLSFDLTPLSHSIGVDVGGFLGFHLMSQFAYDFNYRDGLANIAFDQNRRYAVLQQSLGGNPYGFDN